MAQLFYFSRIKRCLNSVFLITNFICLIIFFRQRIFSIKFRKSSLIQAQPMQSKINGNKAEKEESVFVQRSAAVYKIAQNSHSLLDEGETAAQSGPQSAETPTRKSISDISKDQLTIKERVIKDKELGAGEHSDDSHAENLQSHSAYIENLIHEDPGQTESSGLVSDQVERRATHSGDEDGQQTSAQSLQKHSNTDKHPYDCLSHQLTSHQTPFAEHAQQQRRVSEHGATLTQSQNSPWQFNHLQHSHNSTNAYGWSNNSEVNSELVEKNSGGPNQNKLSLQNLSDGDLCHLQKPTLARGDDGMQPLQKTNRPVGSPPNVQSSNLPHFTETAIYQGQPAGHNVVSPYHLNGVQFNDGPQQFEKIRQYNNSESMQKHDDQQRGQYPEFFSPVQHDPSGSHPQIRSSQAPFYNNTMINDFNIFAQENSQQQLTMQQMQQQQQLWQYQYHQKMQLQSSDHITHAQMVRQAELNQVQQQQYQRQFTGQDQNFAVYPTQVGPHPMQNQTPDTMKATNHSSIFSGNHEFSTSTCSQFNTPDTQRQSQHQVFDSNVNTMSFYEQSAISTPQKGLLFQQMGQNTQTPIKGMNAPDFDPKRAQNKQSTAKAEQLTPNYLMMQKDDFSHENLTPQSIFHPSHSQIDSNHLILQTLASPSPAKAMYQQSAQLIAGSPAEQAFYYQNQHLLMQQRSLTKFEHQQMQNAQLQQQQQLIQQQSFFSQQQQPGNIPQFQHTSENISPRQQTFPGPFQMSEHSSSTTSLQLQQVSPMFANLQIGGSSEAKPSSLTQNSRLPHQDNSVFKVDDGCLHMDQNGLQKQRCSAHGKQGCGHGDAQSSRRDGLIRHTNGGASKGQQQAVAANLTENASDDQIANSLISRLQKLPPSATWKDKEVLLCGKVTNLATTQSGSRYLQNQLLAKSSPPLIEFLLEQVGQTLSTIMINQYGNYFFQKLLTNCSVDQRLRILHLIQNDFIKICCHKQGTHTIQTIFDNVTMDQEENFIKNALQGHVYDLSIDQQGTHVIRKVLQCKSFDEEKQAFIFDEIFAELNELCLNKNGLCVIKIIIALTKTTRQKQRVIEQISHNLIKLVSDPYGNYAVSQIIEKWEQTVCKPIFDILATKIFELSNQKFSSCVIEKCLQYGDSQTRSNFIRKISESERLGALVSHNFGNFVIQTALEKAQGHEKEDLIQAIYRSFPQISDKKIRDKWQLITKDATEDRFRSEDRQYYEEDDYQNSPESVHGSRHQAMSYNDNNHYAQSHQQAHYQEQSFNSNPHREQWSDRGHYNTNPAGSQQQFEYRQKQQQRSSQNQNQNQHHANAVSGQKKQQRHHQNNQHASRRGGGQTTMSKQQSHGAIRDYSDSYTSMPSPSHKQSQLQYQVSQDGGSYRSPRQHQANGGNMNQLVKNGNGGKNEGGRGGTKMHKSGNGFYGRGGHQGNTNASGNFYQPSQNSGASRKHQNEAKDCY